MAHLVGALPLLEGFGADGEGAGAHSQQHDECAQQQRHHWPEDAVHQDAGVMGTPPQDVVRPKGRTEQREPKSLSLTCPVVTAVTFLHSQTLWWSQRSRYLTSVTFEKSSIISDGIG